MGTASSGSGLSVPTLRMLGLGGAWLVMIGVGFTKRIQILYNVDGL